MFKDKLLEARLSNCMTQEEISEKLGVSQAMYNMIEKGIRTPSFSILISLCVILNTTSDFLLSDEIKRMEEKIA